MSTKKPVLILQLRPEDAISDSEFACFLKYGRLQPENTERMRIERLGIPDTVSLDHYSAIIVGGSPFDISTPENRKAPIQKKIENDFKRLLDEVVERDFPFLGACSGNGLLGSFLGTPISGTFREPVSCVSVNITAAGKTDKLLAGFPDSIDVLLGHKEACDQTPQHATLLITGEQCPVQMFRVGENIYATQFHPEADAGEFILRINAYRNHGYFQPQEAEILKRQVSQRPTPYAQAILRRFVSHYVYAQPLYSEAENQHSHPS
ncbi:MAG: glutamine amidotransferase [Porticoccaceae bacterium]|nr:glutamine amidotransferase [Porticoccaceae bacterium]